MYKRGIPMENKKKLSDEIEKLREKMIQAKEQNLQEEKIIEISQKLDRLIVSYLKKNK